MGICQSKDLRAFDKYRFEFAYVYIGKEQWNHGFEPKWKFGFLNKCKGNKQKNDGSEPK